MVQILVRLTDFLHSQRSIPALGPIQPPISTDTGVLSHGVKRPVREVHIHLHIVPMFRMNGAIPPLPICAFMAWTETNLPVTDCHRDP